MQSDGNIPVLTDLIEKGQIEDATTAETDSTELLTDDTEIGDGTDLIIDDENSETADSVELSVTEIEVTELEADRTELRSYDDVEDDIEADASSVDFFIESNGLQQQEETPSLTLSAESKDSDELDAELEATIQRIIDKHMDQAMHEIRLALQLRKR